MASEVSTLLHDKSSNKRSSLKKSVDITWTYIRIHILYRSVNRVDSESETSLTTDNERGRKGGVSDGCGVYASLNSGGGREEESVYGRRTAHRETVDELHELLEALDTSRAAVQAQLDTHSARILGRKRLMTTHTCSHRIKYVCTQFVSKTETT